jgi:hypothetical protein
MVGNDFEIGSGGFVLSSDAGLDHLFTFLTFISCTRESRVPPTLLLIGYWGYFPGIKRPRQEVDHSSQSRAEVRNDWSCASSTPICLPGVDRQTVCTLDGVRRL